jgi:hypothetical protein
MDTPFWGGSPLYADLKTGSIACYSEKGGSALAFTGLSISRVGE